MHWVVQNIVNVGFRVTRVTDKAIRQNVRYQPSSGANFRPSLQPS
jgi:hypothetical protein